MKNSPNAPEQPSLTQLVDIIVLLSADDDATRSAAQQQLQQWKQKSLAHRAMAEKVERSLLPIQQLCSKPCPNQLIKKVIHRELNETNRHSTKSNIWLLVISMSLVFASFFYVYPLPYLTADIRNSSGDWTEHTLQDGSTLILHGKSAVNIHFDHQQRRLELVQGEMYVNVAKEPGRPFMVQSTQGQIKALGTAFSLKKNKYYSQLHMLHSKAMVNTAFATAGVTQQSQYPKQLTINQGYRVDIYKDKILNLQPLDLLKQQLYWQKHRIVFENTQLSQVLEQLNKDFAGKIAYSRQLAEISVNVVLALDDTQTSLQLLQTALPDLRVLYISPYFIYIYKKS
jgi:transmembrane sensor